MLTACPLCGTQTSPGTACPNCGTPTPAVPVVEGGGAGARETPSGHTPSGHTHQWETLLERVRRATAPKYNIRSIIGYGGMAGVYLAEEVRLGRNVAIKVMSPALMVDPRLVDRFVQEARTIAALSHPNIVTIYEVDQREDLHWFAMTYVAGRTLGQVMAEATAPLPVPVIRAWLYQMGDALAYAHHHGIIHRDIKPGNVLLDVRGNALVTDFGIAKVADAETGLTRTGMLVGTPAYMSPEQCASGAITSASDQYSLGAVAYQMLTGQPPFSGPTLAVLQAHVSQQPVPIRELRPDCPDDLLDAVNRMLEKRPEDRWPTLSAAISAAGATPPGLDGPVREQMELLAAPAAGVTVTPWFDRLREGSRESLRVIVVDAHGRVLEQRRVAWSSTDPVVANVFDGVVHAFAPGSTHVRATSGSASMTLPLTVEADPIRDLEIDPAEVTLSAGDRLKLEAIVHDWDGTRLENRAVLWSSSDSAVARVSSDGRVEALMRGAAVITASTGGKSAVANIVVSESVRAERAARVARATLHPTPQRRTSAGSALPLDAQPHREAPAPLQRPSEPVAVTALMTRAGPRKGLWIAAALTVTIAAGVLGVWRPWQRSAPPDAGASVAGPQLAGGDSVQPAGGRGGGGATVGPQAQTRAESTQVSGEPPATRQTEPPAQQRQTQRQEQERQEPPPPRQPPPVVDGTVEVAGNLPPGAVITVRDASGVTTELSGRNATLAAGTYSFEFRAQGYETDQQTVTVRAGQTFRYSPALRAVATPEPPARDTRADQAAVESAIRDFVSAFQRRDTGVVVPLLPSQQRANWRTLLENRGVSNWRAELGDMQPARFEGDSATAPFTVRVSFLTMNVETNQDLRYVATFERTAGGWRLASLRAN